MEIAINVSNIVECQFCKESIERRNIRVKATCFNCKIKRIKKYNRKRKKSMVK